MREIRGENIDEKKKTHSTVSPNEHRARVTKQLTERRMPVCFAKSTLTSPPFSYFKLYKTIVLLSGIVMDIG